MADGFGLREVRISGFRSARGVGFAPGPLCALVGEASVGKSNVLRAIWTLLDPHAPVPVPEDVSLGGDRVIRIAATLHDGREIVLEAAPPGAASRKGGTVPSVFLGGAERSGRLLARPGAAARPAGRAEEIVGAALEARGDRSAASPAAAMLDAVEAWCSEGIEGMVVLVEEPELYLRPQAQRYLYRLLRHLSAANQVIYSTHAPTFLDVARLEELALVEHAPRHGTQIVQPPPLSADESFRALSEFDAERGELFLARAVLLVEGMTEKLTFPFVFRALGHDHDREAISIVECGGKSSIPLFAGICAAARIPFVVVHDRDALPGKRPVRSEQVLNAEIAAIAGRGRVVELAPDFEAVAGLHGHRHKPEHAWRLFAGIDRRQVPRPLADAVDRLVALARSR